MPRTVLLVEEDPAALADLRRTLHRTAYRVLSARGARAAFEVLAVEPVDVIVSGSTVAEGSGIEFLARARLRHPNTVRIVVVRGGDDAATREALAQETVHFSLARGGGGDELVRVVGSGLEQLDTLNEAERLLRAVRRRTRVVDGLESGRPGCSSRPR